MVANKTNSENDISDGIFCYKGYQIPVDLVDITGAGPETFDVISQGHISTLREIVGLAPGMHIVEIGCGIGRDAIPLAEILDPKCSYVGIDIIARSIEWCRNNISKRHPNFQFHHFDVKDQLHNPGGSRVMSDYYLPVENKSVDLIILWSVFTHMFHDDIVHYLREFRRVMKCSGKVMASVFIVNDEVIESAKATDLTPYSLRFEHDCGDGCFINDPVHPLGAVAYTEEALNRMVAKGGLKTERVYRGGWSGLHDTHYGQDMVVLRYQPTKPSEQDAKSARDSVGKRCGPDDRDRHIAKLTQALEERDRQIIGLNQMVAERDHVVAEMLSSRSWRVTRPLRVLGRVLKTCFGPRAE